MSASQLRIAIAAFTKAGIVLALDLRESLQGHGHAVSVAAPVRLAGEGGVEPMADLASWARRSFATANALVFVGAAGIAVRAVAPHVADKFADPAVVCVSEDGRFAIPLLSGHVGGANELARSIAESLGGIAVLTTATDVKGRFAVDEWARSQGLSILDRAHAKEVSAALLDGMTVGIASDYPIAGPLPEGLVRLGRDGEAADLGISISLEPTKRPYPRTLRLVPRILTVGIGCRRGATADAIAQLIDGRLAEAHISPAAVRVLATIDIKEHEEGIVTLARKRGWELRLHSAHELAGVPGAFSSSDFVLKSVGVDNVCERAACAEGEHLLLPRQSAHGVTAAVGSIEPRLSFPSAVMGG